MIDPEKQIPNIISNSRYAGLFILMMAHGEMPYEDILKYVSTLKGGRKLADLINAKFDFTNSRIQGCPKAKEGECGEEEECEGTLGFKDRFINALKQNLDEYYESKNENSFQFNTTFRKKAFETLAQFKMDLINSTFNANEGADKITYMKSFIDKVFELLGKDPIEGIAEKIVKEGSINSLISHAIFSDTIFRQKTENVIKNCQTFKELKKYNCEDINKARRDLFRELYSICVQYDIPEDEASKICIQLEKNPQSNIVASSPFITVATKKNFYSSTLYKNNSLKKYAQLNHYSKSLIYNAREQSRIVIEKVNQMAKLNEDTINKILSFNVFDLLKINSIAPVKKDIFNKILECKSYLKAFKKIRYQKKTIQSLSQDELINISFSLKQLFLEINLPFEAWQQAQKSLLAKNFAYISKLQLSNDSHNTLITYIFDNIEKYYHEEQKQMSYRDEIFFHILSLLMQSNLSDNMKFDKLFKIATETIQTEEYYSEDVDELGKGLIKEYKADIITDQRFLEFKNNDRADIKEDKYNKSKLIRKYIYEINAKDKIKVSFDAIEAFIKEVIEGDGDIPEEYQCYITNLKLLEKKLNPPEVEQQEVVVTKKVEGKGSPKKKGKVNPDQLKKEYEREVAAFVKDYTAAEEQSRFQKGLNEKFANDALAYIKKIIETNAFNNPESPFFAELGYNAPITRQFKVQFAKNSGTFSAKLKRAAQILTLLAGESQPSSPSKSVPQKEESSPTKIKGTKGVDKGQLEAEFVNLSNAFVAGYIAKFEDSLLEKAFEKFMKDSTKLVRDIIQKGALTNKQSEFFASLGMNAPLTRKIKAEFDQNNAYFNEQLKRCIEIEGLLK